MMKMTMDYYCCNAWNGFVADVVVVVVAAAVAAAAADDDIFVDVAVMNDRGIAFADHSINADFHELNYHLSHHHHCLRFHFPHRLLQRMM